MKCRKCGSVIGSIEKGFIQKEIAPVKREEYYRIFADDKEIEKEKSNNAKREKLKQINYMTLEQYKIKYIYKTYKKEKGVYMSLINQFKSDEKVVRNLSQLSYRLLNFILYSHLYFAFLITEKSEFNRYKPINLDWLDTLSECWNALNNELIKEKIDSVDKFINFSFIELFPILNKEKTLEKYEELDDFEKKLEIKIREIIKKYRDENNKNN